MNKRDLIQIAANYMRIWNAGGEDQIEVYADENIEVEYTHFAQKYTGKQQLKDMLAKTHEFFPDMKITLEEFIPGVNKVTVVWYYDATHLKGNLFGVEASGRLVKVSGISILDVSLGKVTKEKGIVDNLSLVMQLGIIK